jgi:hypothetical protein
VTDLDTPIVGDPSEADAAEHPAGRRLRPRSGLPGGRAVVGALLVAGSAVGIAAAHLQASAAPSTSYLVADQPIAPGTRFATLEEVLAVVGRSAIDLPPTVAARALPLEEADALVGHVVVAPLERGDLVTRTAVVADGGVAGPGRCRSRCQRSTPSRAACVRANGSTSSRATPPARTPTRGSSCGGSLSSGWPRSRAASVAAPVSRSPWR